MFNPIRHIPNALTSGNLISGCAGLIALLNNYPVEPAYFIWLACVFDFLDGFSARLLKVTSPIGKELDSLADMVSFGVLPALTIFQWAQQTDVSPSLTYLTVLVAVFSALRLAKFNIDSRQTESFIGLPTPANALLISALTFLPESIRPFVFSGYSLVAISLLCSFLLVAPFELFALKFKSFKWQDNKVRFIFILISLVLIILFKAGSLPFIILLYILISLMSKILARQKM